MSDGEMKEENTEMKRDTDDCCLQCYIYRFREKLGLPYIHKIHPSILHRLLILHKLGGDVEFVKLDLKRPTCKQKLCGIKSLVLHSEQSIGVVTLDVKFCCHTDADEICLYSLSGETLTCTVKKKLKEIDASAIKAGNISKIDVVSYCGPYVTLNIGYECLQVLQVKQDSLQSVSVIDLPKEQRGSKCFQLLSDIVAVFHFTESKIYFQALQSGVVFTQLDVSFLKIAINDISTWYLSEDLKTLVIAFHDLSILHVDLEAYTSKYPQWIRRTGRLSLDGDQSLFLRSETCQFGDFPWKARLLSLHDDQVKNKPIPWYKRIKTSGPKGQTKHNYKHGANVTGFGAGSPRGSLQSVVIAPSRLNPPECVRGFILEEISVGQSLVTLVYRKEAESCLCTCDPTTNDWSTQRFSRGEHILLTCHPGLPHMIAMESYLACMLTDKSKEQEDFVSELMVYGGASIADAVCHLNRWGRCSIPIHTLEVGLKHRQLDTVSFFLKSKEKLFTSTKTKATSPLPSPRMSPSWAAICNHHDNLIQLEPAIDLLTQSVRDSIADKHNHHFAKKLLDILMEFLYDLLLDAMSLNEILTIGQEQESTEERRQLHDATEKLLSWIEEVRCCVRTVEDKHETGDFVDGEKVAEDGKNSDWERWDHMDTQMVIEECICNGRIPDLQNYLCERGELQKGDYSCLMEIGLKWCIDCLHRQEMAQAKDLISKLGMNIADKLWDVALYTLDISLRNFILEQLKSMSTLQPYQVAMVTFLHQLSDLYPTRSFESVKEGRSLATDSSSLSERLRQLSPVVQRYDLSADCSSLSLDGTSGEPVSDEPVAGYCELLLDWTQHWDTDTRDRILLDVLIHKQDFPEEKFSKDVIWDYLTSHNMVAVCTAWIDGSFGQGSEDSWPASVIGPLPPDFVNRLENCSLHVQHIVLKQFARHGIYSREDVADFPRLVRKMNEVGGVLCIPHPLQQSPFVQVDQFHMDMVQYCVNNRLPDMLWVYTHKHQLPMEFLHSVEQPQHGQNWLSMLSHFYPLSRSPTDKDAMYLSSVSNAAYIYGQESGSVGHLIQGGYSLAALATLMYSRQPLQQVTFVVQNMEAFDGLSSETVERAIIQYPKLHATLFPASMGDTPQSDINVYQLLQGNAPFDPSRLFGWQSANTCAGEDALKELPYFSAADLVARFAYSEQIRYTYYLKQGRPSFAFVSFLVEEFNNGCTAIPTKRLMVALGTALWIGVKNFHRPQVSSSCVVFLELLGHDSLLLRTYLQIGNEILTHKNNAITGTLDKRKEQTKKNEEEIVDVLLGCIQNKRKYGPEVLHALEAAILAGLAKDRVVQTTFEAANRWTLAVLFCHLLRLPYTTVFLEACAQANKWLPFIWFSQMHQYPKEQMQGLLHLFPSHHLQEHLRYVVENAEIRAMEKEPVTVAEKKSVAQAKDVRSTLYARIGLAKEKESDDSVTSEEEETSHDVLTGLQGGIKDDTEDDITVNADAAPADVFGVVFAAQSSKCPWKSLLAHGIVLKNPIFTELAACFPGSSVVPCLCGWLLAMMESSEQSQFLLNHGKSFWKYSLSTLDLLIDVYLKHQWGSTLAAGLDIFQPISPLLPFLKFYSEFTERKNFQACKMLLEEFKESMYCFRHESNGRSGGTTLNVLGDSAWLEQTTYRIIQHMLTKTPSVNLVLQLLRLLDSESITLVFSFDVPDFRTLFQMIEIVQNSDMLQVNLASLLTPGGDFYANECEGVIGHLMSKQQFHEARNFAKLAGVSADYVTVTEIKSKQSKIHDTVVWTSGHARRNFYRECAELMKKHSVSPSCVAQFFEQEAEATDNFGEKAFLYELCLNCMFMDDDGNDRVLPLQMYRKMWSFKIQQKVQVMENIHDDSETADDIFFGVELPNQKPASSNKGELLCFGKMPRAEDKPQTLSQQEEKALSQLIGELLTEGRISESCRVASEFNMYNQDLAIILICIALSVDSSQLEVMRPEIDRILKTTFGTTCIRLSLGELQIESMEAEMLHLMRTEPGIIHRQSVSMPLALLKTTSSMISLMSVAPPQLDFLSQDKEEVIATMEILYKHCNQGQQSCRRIITAYKIAAVLAERYEDIVTADDFEVLQSLLKTDCAPKFKLATDYLTTSLLSPAEVAGFLSDSIVEAFTVPLGENDTGSQGKELFIDPHDSQEDFFQVIRLCQEPSLLGDRLLDAVASLAGDVQQVSKQVLSVQTELLILAHECHTAACNMEGISNVLRAARILTTYLETAKEFTLMTRLLIGVGRFNEMTYIFDALQQNHQFELLLGRGMEKETKLKMAILDYLKRYHPTDKDTYAMVALNFMMYREIAEQMEKSALKGLSKLKEKQLDTASEASLQKIAQYFSDAAESYIKDNCLRHAQSCLRQARLVALQMKYLATGQQFINLTSQGVRLLLAEHPLFSEAFIVSEAYGRRDIWGIALCNNVIIRGDMKYLQEFRAHLKLTPTLIEEAVRKYQQMSEKPSSAMNHIKKLLPYCKDVRLQYQLAKELSLRDIIMTLEKGDAKSYIQDLVKTMS